jgi:hypothetical protein
MIEFACPACHAALSVRDENAGLKGRCPKCGEKRLVPHTSAPRDRHQGGPALSTDSLGIDEERREPGQAGRREISALVVVLFVFRCVMWAACVFWVFVCIVDWHMRLPRAQSAVQEAALAAATCVWIISAYVVCRAIDSATRK